MDNTFRIPGTLGPEITVGRSFLGNVRVLVDGQKATRRKSRTLAYLIPMSDGSTSEMALTGRWTGLKALVPARGDRNKSKTGGPKPLSSTTAAGWS
jgi:hypothetical protein